MAEIQGEEIYLEHSGQEIDDAVDAVAGKADATDLTAEVTARAAADTALQTAVGNRIPFQMGTVIEDPDPDNDVRADLFTLSVGKYVRQSAGNKVLNIPPDFTAAAFYCFVENTISNQRRRIVFYPATQSTANCFYICTEFSGGTWSSWYKFEGTAVVS